MLETALMHRILLAFGNGATRLFRCNVGVAWVGKPQLIHKTTTVTVHRGDVIVREARPFKAGVPGMSDLIGWQSRTITPEDVGRTLAIYTAVETKGERTRVTEDQVRFIEAVNDAGGIAGIVRSEEEAAALLQRR